MPWFRVQIREGDLDAAKAALRGLEIEVAFAHWVTGSGPKVIRLTALVDVPTAAEAEQRIADQLPGEYRLEATELRKQ